MRSVKRFIAAILFVAICLNVSCSQDELTPGNDTEKTSSRMQPNVQKLAAEYVEISKTTTYADLQSVRLLMVDKLNGHLAPLENEAAFKGWLINNISTTDFESVNEAVTLNNLGIALSTKLMTENSRFYAELPDYTLKQRKEIFALEFAQPILSKDDSICVRGCVSAAIQAFIENDAVYSEGMSSWNPIEAWVFGEYHSAVETSIINSYQNCFNRC